MKASTGIWSSAGQGRCQIKGGASWRRDDGEDVMQIRHGNSSVIQQRYGHRVWLRRHCDVQEEYVPVLIGDVGGCTYYECLLSMLA